MRKIADSTVRRLSLYLRYLEEFETEGQATVSSEALATRGGTTSAQVRKDLSFFGSFGKRGLGYPVAELSERLRRILGLDRRYRVVVVGAGKIGSALVQYRGFRQRGFDIVALFDSDPSKIGRAYDGLVVRDMAELETRAPQRITRHRHHRRPGRPGAGGLGATGAGRGEGGAQLRARAAACAGIGGAQERESRAGARSVVVRVGIAVVVSRSRSQVSRSQVSRSQRSRRSASLSRSLSVTLRAAETVETSRPETLRPLRPWSLIDAFPTSTLLDRALIRLADAPQSAAAIARDVLGMPNAPRSVADRLAAALLGSDPRTSQLPDGRWALIAAAAGSPMLDECAFAVVDVETTGSRALGDRVLELGIVVVQGTRRELIYDRVVNPERPVPWAITNLTRHHRGGGEGGTALRGPGRRDHRRPGRPRLRGAQCPLRLGLHRHRAPPHPRLHARGLTALHGRGWPGGWCRRRNRAGSTG